MVRQANPLSVVIACVLEFEETCALKMSRGEERRGRGEERKRKRRGRGRGEGEERGRRGEIYQLEELRGIEFGCRKCLPPESICSLCFRTICQQRR